MSDLPSVRDDLAWKLEPGAADVSVLDALAPAGGWGGPIVVSMPRTGSTLLGTIFLLLRSGDGEHVFERYIHEPVSPVFWEDEPLRSVVEMVGTLSGRDIIQESAYQFASKEIAGWFVRRTRKPVGFVMRHPQLSWPSRWRIMLNEWVAAEPSAPDAPRFTEALERDDFSDLGDVLTERVTQPDNGWCAFTSLIGLCDDEGIEIAIVDNARFRADPDRVLGRLCDSWGLQYDDSMTAWNDLAETRSRIVMTDLAAGPEYEAYYAATLASSGGIVREDRDPLPLDRFPEVLRGESGERLTIDHAVAWYEELLARPETLG